MRHDVNSFYILQVSDFHISEESKDSAKNALQAVTNKIKEMNIDIKYLIHTGDVINSKDIDQKIEEKCGPGLKDEEYDDCLDEFVQKRFEIAKEIFGEFENKLDVMRKNIVICCGNHDKVRYKTRKKDAFKPFQKFLENVCSHTKLTDFHRLDDLNVLVLNTNISNDKKVTCVDCENLKKILSVQLHEELPSWFYTYGENVNISEEENKVNVIVAHQPLYDICEQIRLPYGSETQTTDFLSALQDFINGNGIYLCGDKHTSSIAASYIHDIPHFFCGHPFVFEKNNFPSDCVHKDLAQSQNSEIDYNLIEISDGKTGQVRKIHLVKKEDGSWKCQVQPIDAVVSNLYEKSRKYIVKNSFALLANQSGTRYSSWANLSWRNLFSRLDTGITTGDLKEISEFYGLFCRLKNSSNESIGWDDEINIFYKLCKIVTRFMHDERNPNLQNIINVRGDYSSGKSTFLGLFYIYLLYRYSYGKIDYIPAYFNMENDDILNKIQAGSTYARAVKQTFASFIKEVEIIAQGEHTSVCYIIDGLDEQDIWSESSQDSVGRVALDILAETNNSKYIMSFCQNRLARFKNTMSAIKYYEKSYVMYFNSISVKEKEVKNSNFVHFAPAMAYLFTYEGYTYERFKAISPSTTVYWEQKILKYSHKIYKTFIFIKKHKDAREYLLALHYNRELRYFAENPKAEIPEYSIINRLIPRNISIIIKKLWRTDQNKFIIVCRNLIEKRIHNNMPINNCTLSMLIYILAYLDKLPDYIRDEIKDLLRKVDNMGERLKKVTEEHTDPWEISGDNSQRMKKFIDLNFLHSQKIIEAIDSNSSVALVKELLKKPKFALYNRQYMMWYYGDLTIYGENRINNLVPGKDEVNKGIDYYNCFYTLYHKLYSHFENQCKGSYPLLEYDLFTIWDLAFSRQSNKKEGVFCSVDEKEVEIYTCLADMLNKYVDYYCKGNVNSKEDDCNADKIEETLQDLDAFSKKELLENIINRLDTLNMETDERYIHYFFKLIANCFLNRNNK